jgi:hypothetical protein
MTHMHPDRAMAKRIAAINGYFWLPCPACGQHFGGHEVFRVGGHECGLPCNWDTADNGMVYAVDSKGICPDCTAAGVGCRAYAEHGLPMHHDCSFLATTQPTELHNGHDPLP